MRDRARRLETLALLLAQLRKAAEGELIRLLARRADLVQQREDLLAAIDRIVALDGLFLASAMRRIARIDGDISRIDSDIAAQRQRILGIHIKAKGVSRLSGRARVLQERAVARRDLSELACGASLRQAPEA